VFACSRENLSPTKSSVNWYKILRRAMKHGYKVTSFQVRLLVWLVWLAWLVGTTMLTTARECSRSMEQRR